MKGLFFFCVLALFSCATPVRSTVDGYGEGPLSKSDLLYFDRDILPLAQRPVADSCREAARAQKVAVAGQNCPGCRRVEVRSQLAGTSSAIAEGPRFGSSVGFMGGSTGIGLGIGTGGRTEDRSERVIEIGIFGSGQEPIRSITVRSLGRGQSVAAVAYEMCFAAFQDYPQNLRGKVYEVKPGGGP